MSGGPITSLDTWSSRKMSSHKEHNMDRGPRRGPVCTPSFHSAESMESESKPASVGGTADAKSVTSSRSVCKRPVNI